MVSHQVLAVQKLFAFPGNLEIVQNARNLLLKRSILPLDLRRIADIKSGGYTVVIGAPMYNFTISAPLKAWIDQIVRMGKTFSHGPEGSKGLLRNKNVVVITARGGSYAKDTPTEPFDFQEPFLRYVLSFIGLSEAVFIHADKLAKPDAEGAVSCASKNKLFLKHKQPT
jgi:FMN-dependent NADH-azoreductase